MSTFNFLTGLALQRVHGLSRRLALVLLCSVGLLMGCSSQQLADYVNETPKLDLREFFNGELTAHGVFSDRSGQVVKRFTVAMKGTWSAARAKDPQGVEQAVDVGVLEEDFVYSDGTLQRRVWTLTRWPDGRYSGRADDVVGEASGQESGNVFYWTYTLALPVDQRIINVRFEDWMYLMSPTVMLNKAQMSKWGVHLGDVTLSFYKAKS